MQLAADDVLRLENAAYGLAEAPRAWFLRLSRELSDIGLVVSQLDPCVYCLRCGGAGPLRDLCGIRVDDLLGRGNPQIDSCLARLRARLPFGDFRWTTVRG